MADIPLPPLDPVASRMLEVDGMPGFQVCLGRPRLDPAAGNADQAWVCDYELDGPETQLRGEARGCDALQALVQAVYGVQAQVARCAEHLAGRLTWYGHNRHFGLPREGDPHPKAYRARLEALRRSTAAMDGALSS